MRKSFLSWLIDLINLLFFGLFQKSEKAFLSLHANKEVTLDDGQVEKFSTATAIEVLLYATAQELNRCKENCDPLREELSLYKEQYQKYRVRTEKVIETALYGGCPCEDGEVPEEGELYCNWQSFAVSEWILNFAIRKFEITDSAGNIIFKKGVFKDQVRGKDYYSLIQLNKSEIKKIDEAVKILVNIEATLNNKIITKSMMIDTAVK